MKKNPSIRVTLGQSAGVIVAWVIIWYFRQRILRLTWTAELAFIVLAMVTAVLGSAYVANNALGLVLIWRRRRRLAWLRKTLGPEYRKDAAVAFCKALPFGPYLDAAIALIKSIADTNRQTLTIGFFMAAREQGGEARLIQFLGELERIASTKNLNAFLDYDYMRILSQALEVKPANDSEP
jgi:hypothetical protein